MGMDESEMKKYYACKSQLHTMKNCKSKDFGQAFDGQKLFWLFEITCNVRL